MDRVIDRVNVKQFLCITFLVGLTMKMFMLPVLIMRICGRDSFIVMIIAMSADVVLLAFIAVVIYLSGDNTFFELFTRAFGKLAAKIIALIVGVFYLFKLFMVIADITIFFSTTVFNVQMSFIHLIPLIALFGYFAYKPLSSIGRVSQIFTPIVIVSMLILGTLTIPEVDFSGLLPLVGEGWDKITTALMSFTLWFGDFTVLLILVGKTDNSGKKIFWAIVPAIVSGLLLLAFSTVLFASYGDMPQVLTYGHNISNMTQYAVGSFKFGRFDLIIFCMWLMAVFLSAGLMSLFFARSMDFVFGDKLGKILTAGAGIAMFSMYLIFSELNRTVEFMTMYFWLPSLLIQYLLPPLCLIALWIGNAREKYMRRKYEKIKQKA